MSPEDPSTDWAESHCRGAPDHPIPHECGQRRRPISTADDGIVPYLAHCLNKRGIMRPNMPTKRPLPDQLKPDELDRRQFVEALAASRRAHLDERPRFDTSENGRRLGRCPRGNRQLSFAERPTIPQQVGGAPASCHRHGAIPSGRCPEAILMRAHDPSPSREGAEGKPASTEQRVEGARDGSDPDTEEAPIKPPGGKRGNGHER